VTTHVTASQYCTFRLDTLTFGVEVVEDLLPLYEVRVGVRLKRPASRVSLAPCGETLKHEEADGVIWVTVPQVHGHQVVVFE
jgi:hypothetical protein